MVVVGAGVVVELVVGCGVVELVVGCGVVELVVGCGVVELVVGCGVVELEVGAGVVELVVATGVVEVVVGAGVVTIMTSAQGPPAGPVYPELHVQSAFDLLASGELELTGQKKHPCRDIAEYFPVGQSVQTVALSWKE